MNRRSTSLHLLTLLFATVTGTAAAGDLPTTAATPRQITWADLIPKGWDAAKAMHSIDISNLHDDDPRANALLVKMREAADAAPANTALADTAVRIPGFIVPLEEAGGEISEFLLVPYFGACIHSPPPPANQIIHVKAPAARMGLRSMDMVWVTGTLQISHSDTEMGVSGYHISAEALARYTGAGSAK